MTDILCLFLFDIVLCNGETVKNATKLWLYIQGYTCTCCWKSQILIAIMYWAVKYISFDCLFIYRHKSVKSLQYALWFETEKFRHLNKNKNIEKNVTILPTVIETIEDQKLMKKKMLSEIV